MKKATGAIIGLVFTATLTLYGCASGDSGNHGETSYSVGGMTSVMEKFEETALDAEGAVTLMEQYESRMAGTDALKKLEKAEPEIVDEGFRLLCSRYIEKYEEAECVQLVVDAWADFEEYLSLDNDFAEGLGTMIEGYQTAQSGMKAVEGKYTNIHAFYQYETRRGFLHVDGIGLLYWEDDEEQAGENCVFEKYSDDVLR